MVLEYDLRGSVIDSVSLGENKDLLRPTSQMNRALFVGGPFVMDLSLGPVDCTGMRLIEIASTPPGYQPGGFPFLLSLALSLGSAQHKCLTLLV